MSPQDDNDDFNMNPFSMGITGVSSGSRPKTHEVKPELPQTEEKKPEEKKPEEKKGLLNKIAEKVIIHKEESTPKKEAVKVGGLSLADDNWDLGAIASNKANIPATETQTPVAESPKIELADENIYINQSEVSADELEKSLAMVGVSDNEQDSEQDAENIVSPSLNQGDVENQHDEKKGKKRLGETLIDLGLLSEDQLQVALKEQRATRKLLGQVLIEMGFITESTMAELMAESAGVQRFDPRSSVLDPALIRKLPKEIASRYKVIPVSLEGNNLSVAMADLYNVVAIDQLRRHFPKDIKITPLFCVETDLLEIIDQYYDYEVSIEGILKEIETGIRDKSVRLDGETQGYVNPMVRLVDALLVDAIKKGVSDIHFEPETNFVRLRYRIDGRLEQVRSFHKSYWSAIVVRVKIMAGMNIAESRLAQDGRITYNVLGREVDFRVATQPTVHGENIVMRLLDKRKALLPLQKLGFSRHNFRILEKMLKRPEGIIIVTGPTGSGKTSTLYSILSYINNMDVNIMTLEDPVEYQLPLIRQSSVREGTTLSFSGGIKSLMRQDPDIIFIGEVRDEDTAMMAVRAALTGHQVFTTLHTNDSIGAIPRLMDMGIPKHLLAGSLIGVMAQRLTRKLCNHCKKPRLATPEECRIMGFSPDNPPTVHDAVGCDKCDHKGYKGRTAIVEIMQLDRGFDELVSTGSTRKAMLEYALESGFVPMIDDGIDKVINGDIDLKELIDTIDMTERL